MDIHKPKPWHGAREFLKEYLIIFVGVLTALGAEQVAAALEWRAKLAEAREGLADELAEDLGKAEVRIRLSPCVEQRLDTLAAVVDEAARTGRLPPLSTPRPPPYNSWSTGVWESAVSAQTTSHMPVKALRAYTRAYQVIARLEAAAPQEVTAWTTLFGLAGPGRAFGPGEAQVYREAIGQARTLNGLAAGFGVRAHQIIDAHRLPYDAETYHARVDPVAVGGRCETYFGRPPASYGASPTSEFADYARRNPTR